MHCAEPRLTTPVTDRRPLAHLSLPPSAPNPPKVRIVRIFNTYGPRMALDDGRVVSNFVAQALTNQPITVYGDGAQTRSFQ